MTFYPQTPDTHEGRPLYDGRYAAVAADLAIASVQLVAAGAFVGEDPEPDDRPALIFGNPTDEGVAVHGPPEQLREFVARAVELVADL